MVGDSMAHDIDGAIGVGMRGVLVRRSEAGAAVNADRDDVPVIKSLLDLPAML
jgi:FMN phosphatase YigB (HAD superfamily)